jgi:hypothetical protein
MFSDLWCCSNSVYRVGISDQMQQIVCIGKGTICHKAQLSQSRSGREQLCQNGRQKQLCRIIYSRRNLINERLSSAVQTACVSIIRCLYLRRRFNKVASILWQSSGCVNFPEKLADVKSVFVFVQLSVEASLIIRSSHNEIPS